jgi:hypothetical protein
MKILDNVTLCCIDCIDLNRSMNALMRSSLNLKFKSIKLLSSKSANHPKINFTKIPYLCSKLEYSDFVLKSLNNYIDTDFVLIVQWDGFILNHNAWDDEFLKYDYIGAPWAWDYVVGNGGFSLRSKKLLEMTQNFHFQHNLNEDHMICRIYRNDFENLGIKFAPYEIAKQFSVENEEYQGSLGFHGGVDWNQRFNKWLSTLEVN